MFTGIIEGIGKIEAVEIGAESARVLIHTPENLGSLTIGESIAVDGVCLTAELVADSAFAAAVSPETLSRTTLGLRRRGDGVNLERALPLGARLGGHLVAGHVDSTGRIRSFDKREASWDLAVEAPSGVLQLCVEKGSIAVDGVSLTIASLQPWGFVCAIIPHTHEQTTLRWRQPGDKVNLESDLIGKYVQRLLNPSAAPSNGVTWEALEQSGFL